ncbi:MAG TPA: phage tail protein [Tepidisphaeraceae bacterium]|jgi:phage tail-like protein|nr:phage tail protein [Tepidisphaeraceae bacterium]
MPDYPFIAFNFSVEISVDGVAPHICGAAFSECDGLEITQEVKTIREGGNNGKQIRLAGPLTYGTLTLKRGMTSTFDLWTWFDAVQNNPALRSDGEVVMFAADGKTAVAKFHVQGCIPLKIKAPALNGKDGALAVEEFQIAYESLKFEKP